MDFENTISCEVKELPDLIRNAEHNTMFVVSGECKNDSSDFFDSIRELYETEQALKDVKSGIKIGLDLKNVTGIRDIDNNEFNECPSLAAIKLPDTIEELSWTFNNCTSLESVEIPKNVENCISNNIFVSCKALKELKTTYFKLDGDFIVLHIEDLEDNEGMKGAFLLSFLNKNNETDVAIPDDVVIIANGAFCNCDSIKNIKIPEGVMQIGISAFRECTSLTEIKIPDSVKTIESSAFDSCKSLKSVILPKGITEIESRVFSGCESLENVEIPNNITSIGTQSFSGCASLKRIEIPESVTEIERCAFESCTSLEEIRIPKKVTNLHNDIFENCSSLKQAFIPKGCKIGLSTFPKNTEIFEYSISDGGKEICEKRCIDFPVTATSFDDVLEIDDESIQMILREIDTQELAKALKGSSEEIRQKIFNNMSKRAAAMLKEDMEFMGPIRRIDVEESKQRILAIIQELEKFGTIKLNITTKRQAPKDNLRTETQKPKEDEEILDTVFTFNDIIMLDDNATKIVLRETDTKTLAKALKGDVSEEAKKKIFDNLTEQAASMLKEDMESIDSIKETDIEEAKENVIEIIRKLEEEGTILIVREGDELIY